MKGAGVGDILILCAVGAFISLSTVAAIRVIRRWNANARWLLGGIFLGELLSGLILGALFGPEFSRHMGKMLAESFFALLIWGAAWGSAAFTPQGRWWEIWNRPFVVLGPPMTPRRWRACIWLGWAMSLLLVGIQFRDIAQRFDYWSGSGTGKVVEMALVALAFAAVGSVFGWQMGIMAESLTERITTLFHGGPMDGRRLGGGGEATCEFEATFNGAKGLIVYYRRAGPPELSGRDTVHHMDYAGFTRSKPSDKRK